MAYDRAGSAVAAALFVSLVVAGCSTLLDLDDLGSGATGATAGTGAGATSANGGAGGDGAGPGGSGGDGATGGAAGGASGGAGSAGGSAGGAGCCEDLPQGWLGPVTSAFGPLDPTILCPLGETPVTLFTEPIGMISCTGCACGPLTGVTCTLPVNCGSNCDVDATSTTCISISGQNVHCEITGPATVEQMGSCAPQPVNEQKQTWASQYALCPVEDECTDGAACPRSGVCIYKLENTTCPLGWTQKLDAYVGADDTLDCSPCTCTPANVKCEGGGYKTYSSSGCGGIGTAVTSNCSGVPAGHDYLERDPAPNVTGACIDQGGDPIGEFMPTDAATICCRP
jgi:hypothetical protein